MPLATLPRTNRLPARVLAWLLAALVTCLLAVTAAQAAPPAGPEIGPEAVHPNVRIVQDFQQHFAHGEREAMSALVVPDVEWTIPGAHHMAGTRKGLKEILPLLWQLKREGIGTETLYLGGNDNLVVGVSRGRVKRGGVQQEFYWVRVYELREGRILRVQDFPSDQSAADVFFWQAMPPKPAEELIRD